MARWESTTFTFAVLPEEVLEGFLIVDMNPVYGAKGHGGSPMQPVALPDNLALSL